MLALVSFVMFLVIVTGLILWALVIPKIKLHRLRARFPLPPPEMCEACNHPTDDPHTITETFDEGDGTGTEMTAIYCPAHCEGGCDKEHAHV